MYEAWFRRLLLTTCQRRQRVQARKCYNLGQYASADVGSVCQEIPRVDKLHIEVERNTSLILSAVTTDKLAINVVCCNHCQRLLDADMAVVVVLRP